MPRKRQPPRLVSDPKTGIWHVHHWNGARTVRASLGTPDEAQASVRFGFWLTEQDTPGADADRRTVGELLDLYWQEHAQPHAADSTRIEYALPPLRKHFGLMRPTEIKPATVNRYVAWRGKAPGTVRRELTVLIACLNHARKRGDLIQVPHVPLPAAPPPRDRWLTSTEIDRLLALAEKRRRDPKRLSRVERFCWIALEAPARRRSIERLSWPQVDLERGIIDFRTPGRTQTSKRQVPVPISDRLLPVLQRAREERQNDLWVLDCSGSVRKAFEALAKAAGLEDVTPHDLRRTAATRMAQAGVPLAMIAAILGNTVAVVERTYAHWQADALRQAVNYGR
jgi:integrase